VESLTLVLPLPPSANRYWRSVNGRMLVSAQGRAYVETVAMLCAALWKRAPLAGKVGLEVHVHMDLRGDLDNRTKVLLDALQGSLYLNDSQVWDLRSVRQLDRERPRVEVTVSDLGELPATSKSKRTSFSELGILGVRGREGRKI
jgi:crossover junction endodeoxyribonuclease RusA